MNRKFKKFGGEVVKDLGEYAREYIKKNPGETIYIGCDSNVRKNGRKVMYADVIAFYNNNLKTGVHYIFNRELEDGFNLKVAKTGNSAEDRKNSRKMMTSVIFQRIWQEVVRLEELAEYFEEELEGFYPRKTTDELISLGYGAHQNKLIDIDVDINPYPGWTSYQMELMRMGKEPGVPKNRSYIVYDAAKSYLEGKGYRVRFKPDSWAASCSADMICKGG